MAAAQASGVKTVYLVCIEGGPISQVEAMHLPQRRKDLQADLDKLRLENSHVKLEILSCKSWREFEKRFLSRQKTSQAVGAQGGKKKGDVAGRSQKRQRRLNKPDSAAVLTPAAVASTPVGESNAAAQPQAQQTAPMTAVATNGHDQEMMALLRQVLTRLDASDMRLDQLDAKFDRLSSTTTEVLETVSHQVAR